MISWQDLKYFSYETKRFFSPLILCDMAKHSIFLSNWILFLYVCRSLLELVFLLAMLFCAFQHLKLSPWASCVLLAFNTHTKVLILCEKLLFKFQIEPFSSANRTICQKFIHFAVELLSSMRRPNTMDRSLFGCEHCVWFEDLIRKMAKRREKNLCSIDSRCVMMSVRQIQFTTCIIPHTIAKKTLSTTLLLSMYPYSKRAKPLSQKQSKFMTPPNWCVNLPNDAAQSMPTIEKQEREKKTHR